MTLNGDRDVNQHKFHFYFILSRLLNFSFKSDKINKDRFFEIGPRRFIEFENRVSESVDEEKASERLQEPFS